MHNIIVENICFDTHIQPKKIKPIISEIITKLEFLGYKFDENKPYLSLLDLLKIVDTIKGQGIIEDKKISLLIKHIENISIKSMRQQCAIISETYQRPHSHHYR